MSISDASSDQEVVAAFLAVVGQAPAQQVSRDVEGVTADDVSRWRRGKWNYLSGKKRGTLLQYLTEHPMPDGDSHPRDGGDFGTGLRGAALAELYRRVDVIEAEAVPAWLKVLRMDALAATVRAEAMRTAEAASLERAAAIREAEVAGKQRAVAAGEEARSARERVLELRREERPTGADPSPYNPAPEPPKGGERKTGTED